MVEKLPERIANDNSYGVSDIESELTKIAACCGGPWTRLLAVKDLAVGRRQLSGWATKWRCGDFLQEEPTHSPDRTPHLSRPPGPPSRRGLGDPLDAQTRPGTTASVTVPLGLYLPQGVELES